MTITSKVGNKYTKRQNIAMNELKGDIMQVDNVETIVNNTVVM